MNFQSRAEQMIDSLDSFSLNRDQHRQAIEFHHNILSEIKQQDTADHDESYYTNITRCTRILIAKSFNQKEALEMWKKWIQWRVKKQPHKIVEEAIKDDLLTEKAYYFERDNDDCPCLYVIMNRIDPKVKPEINLLYGIYLLEKGCALADESGPGQLNVIIDMQGFGRKNMAANAAGVFTELLKILQDNYPERLHRMFVINTNWLFKILYAAVSPFMSQRTKDKFITNSDAKILHKYIKEDNLQVKYGGTSTWEYKWIPEKEVSDVKDMEIKREKISTIPLNKASDSKKANMLYEEEEKRVFQNEQEYRSEEMNALCEKNAKECYFDGEFYYDCTDAGSGFYQGGCNTDSDLIPFEKFEEEEIKSTRSIVGRCSIKG